MKHKHTKKFDWYNFYVTVVIVLQILNSILYILTDQDIRLSIYSLLLAMTIYVSEHLMKSYESLIKDQDVLINIQDNLIIHLTEEKEE